MTRRTLVLALLVALVPSAALLAQGSAEIRERLGGTWRMKSGKLAWNPEWGDRSEGLELRFDEKFVTLATEKHEQTSRLVKVDVSTTPNRLCLVTRVPDGDREKSVTLWCLFELQGDRLRICWRPAVVGQDYPAGFDDRNVHGSIVLERGTATAESRNDE